VKEYLYVQYSISQLAAFDYEHLYDLTAEMFTFFYAIYSKDSCIWKSKTIFRLYKGFILRYTKLQRRAGNTLGGFTPRKEALTKWNH